MTTNVSYIDAEAKKLLMMLRSQDCAVKRESSSEVQAATSSHVDEEARRLLQIFGCSSSVKSRSSVGISQATSSSSLIRIDTTGMNGRDGVYSRGENAGDIHLHLAVKGEVIQANWEHGEHSISLGDPASSIFLRAVGGNGGSGTKGSNGKAGKDGAPGRNANRYAPGTNGEPGENGKDGEHGGCGGDGGCGGHVKVFVKPEDADLLMLLNIPDVKGGIGGRGGHGGNGGEGGKGGEGGLSWSGTDLESRTRTETTYHGGKMQLRYVTEMVPVPRFNPGGFKGVNGQRGAHGRIGSTGTMGKRGSFTMVVGDTAYSSRYDFLMTLSKIVDITRGNPSDFCEPGEHVFLEAMVTNQGGMPTPPQEIQFSLQSTDWIESPTSSFVLSKQLAEGESYVFPDPFSFRIKENTSNIQERLHQNLVLSYRAVALRVNKAFASISGKQDVITLTYPVQFASMVGRVHPQGGNLFVDVSLGVESVIALGRDSPQKRKVFVRLEIKGNKDINFLTVLEEEQASSFVDSHSTPQKRTFEIEYIDPRSRKQCEFSFYLSSQEKVEVVAFLYLDSFHPENRGMRCIEQKTLQLPQ